MSTPRSAPPPARLWLLVGAVVATAGATLAVGAGGAIDAARERPEAFVSMLLVTLLFQVLAVNVYGRGSISVAGVGLLATGFALGVGPAVAAALAMAVLHAARKRKASYKTLFNAGVFVVSAASAAALYQALGDARTGADEFALAILAGAVFSTVNIGLMTVAMAVAEGLSPRVVWRERFAWMTPHYLAFGPLAFALGTAYLSTGLTGLLAFALPPALLVLSVRLYLDRTRASVEGIRRANLELEATNGQLRALAAEVRKTHRDTIAALSRSMEAKDEYTGGHTERVAVVSVAIAERVGYADEELEAIEIGALLHDIGKVAVPERILNKPGPLDDEEWVVMRSHPEVSERILSAVDLHPFVCQIARWSHERIDGGGYPDGLAGEEIPLPARVVLVADALDALTTDRCYRAGRSVAAAMEEIRACAGTQFCPRAVAGLEAVYRDDPALLEPDVAAIPFPHAA